MPCQPLIKLATSSYCNLVKLHLTQLVNLKKGKKLINQHIENFKSWNFQIYITIM